VVPRGEGFPPQRGVPRRGEPRSWEDKEMERHSVFSRSAALLHLRAVGGPIRGYGSPYMRPDGGVVEWL